MPVPLVHENDIEELDLPGRHLRWLVNKERLNAQHLSMCVIRVQPGQTVKPAHSHPNGEEVIYILTGSGRVYVDGAIDSVRAGTAVLFPQGAIHMLQNSGDEEMKVACFFAPATDLSNYKFFEDVEFPG
jgi:quercetin dioxygenase-like cupin family protein